MDLPSRYLGDCAAKTWLSYKEMKTTSCKISKYISTLASTMVLDTVIHTDRITNSRSACKCAVEIMSAFLVTAVVQKRRDRTEKME